MEFFSLYPGCHEVQSVHADCFRSLDKGKMWWYNIFGDNKGIISYILRLNTITEGSVLLTANLVASKKENREPILTVKIIECRKCIDCFGLSIEADPSRLVKKNIYISVSGIYQALHL